MKILLANWVYNWGSTGYIVRDLKEAYIKDGHQVYVASAVNWGILASDVFLFSNKLLLAIYSRLSKYLGFLKYDGSMLATLRLINYIKHIKPDIIHIHILNNHALNNYCLFRYLSKHNYKTVITHHAEYYYTSCCNYSYDCNQWVNNQCHDCKIPKETTTSIIGNPHKHWLKMSEAFSSFKSENLIFTAVSPWVKQRSLQSPYLRKFRCEVVKNGINTEIFYPREFNRSTIKNELSSLGVKDYLIYVSASFNPTNLEDIKGGYYIVELAKLNPDITFLVVATSNVSTSNLPHNIILWGKAKDQNELAELYSNAKLTVLTSRKETFSMICAESLCCGTPIVGFCAGGPESISIPAYSCFSKFGDIQRLSENVNKWIATQVDKNKISELARKEYSKEMMSSSYMKVYSSLI